MPMTHEKSRPGKGFTLVELLVVIGIIAVLISVLLPVLSRAKDAGYRTQCLANVRQFFIADLAYSNMSGSWHMPGWQGPGDASAGVSSGTPPAWPGIIEFRKTLGLTFYGNNPLQKPDYLPHKWYCPLASRGFGDNTNVDPKTGMDYWVDYAYGMNLQGVDLPPATSDAACEPVNDSARAPQCNMTLVAPFHGYKQRQVKDSASKIMFADAMWYFINEYGVGDAKAFKGWNEASVVSDYTDVNERAHSTV